MLVVKHLNSLSLLHLTIFSSRRLHKRFAKARRQVGLPINLVFESWFRNLKRVSCCSSVRSTSKPHMYPKFTFSFLSSRLCS